MSVCLSTVEDEVAHFRHFNKGLKCTWHPSI